MDFPTFCKMILCGLPDILTMIIPMCFLISGIHVCHKMKTDQELIVMMTSGKSVFSIAKPLLFLAILLSMSMFYIQSDLTPFSHKNMEIIQRHVRNKISMSVIRPGAFNILGNSVVYIDSKTENSLDNIFISYIPNGSNKTNIITAKSGRYDIRENKLLITLINGFRQALGEKNDVISTVKFEEFSYDVTDFIKRFSSSSDKPHEKTQKELFELANTTKENKLRIKYLSEAYGRYATSSIPFINCLFIALFLIIASSKTDRVKRLIQTFSAGLTVQIGIISLVNLSRKFEVFLIYEHIIIILVILTISIFAFSKKKI